MNITIKKLNKSFDKKAILKDVSLIFNPGNIYCLVGKNGAGKTTLFHILLQLISLDSGTIEYDGKVYENLPVELKQRIGFAGDSSFIIEELTLEQYLMFIAKLYGLSPNEAKNRTDDLVAYLFDTSVDLIKRPIAAFSTGMKKKASICASVIHSPDCIILDEPFAGLDPIAAQKVINLINDLKKSMRTIIISSHDIEYIEVLQSRIILIDEAKIVFDGPYSEIGGIEKSLNESIIDLLQPKAYEKLSWI